ncbi:unnamed protein product, partial [Laminaria digitata]
PHAHELHSSSSNASSCPKIRALFPPSITFLRSKAAIFLARLLAVCSSLFKSVSSSLSHHPVHITLHLLGVRICHDHGGDTLLLGVHRLLRHDHVLLLLASLSKSCLRFHLGLVLAVTGGVTVFVDTG